MSCLLPLIAGACLLDPSHIELHGNVSGQISGDFRYHSGPRDYGGGTVGMFKVSAGADITRSVTLEYGVWHTSLLDTRSDRGEWRAFGGLTWRPFR